MTQNEQIIRYLKRFGSITQVEAAHAIGCYRLGARIWDLRAAGYNIKTENVTKKNKDGHRVTYARYTLEA